MTIVAEIGEVNSDIDSLGYQYIEYNRDGDKLYSLTFEQIKTLYTLAKNRGYDKGAEDERDAWMCK